MVTSEVIPFPERSSSTDARSNRAAGGTEYTLHDRINIVPGTGPDRKIAGAFTDAQGSQLITNG